MGRLNSVQCDKKVIKQGKMSSQMSLFGLVTSSDILFPSWFWVWWSPSNPFAFLWITKEMSHANANHFYPNWYWFKTFILWPNKKCFKILSMNMVTKTEKIKSAGCFLSRRGLKSILICTSRPWFHSGDWRTWKNNFLHYSQSRWKGNEEPIRNPLDHKMSKWKLFRCWFHN